MGDQGPLVSVLMTAYNREKYIAEAIESVLISTYQNFELIIVDDCSKDNTVKIANFYKLRDHRIKLFINDRNLGDYPNRNKAASYAKGKYLKYLDSDDKLFDFSLQYCIEQMEKFPDAAMGMLYLYKDDINDSVSWESKKIVHSHFFIRTYLCIGPSGTIIRRDKFEGIGGFDTRFGVASDNFFNIKLASFCPIVLLPKVFIFYRLHEEQEKGNNQTGYLKYGYLYFKELLERVPLPLTKNEIKYLSKKMTKRFAVNLTRYFLLTGNIKSLKKIMKETNFGFADIILGYFK